MDEQSDARLQNPFPGLRAFEANETQLFFGREGQSDEIVKILGCHHFVAVVGTSGSGKSSLVRAGMIPSLEAGYMAHAGSSWRFAVMRPGEHQDPIASLAHRLADPAVFGDSEIGPEALARIIDTTLRRSSFGLIEAARQQRLRPQENLLVLVDQFEELFRLRNSRARNATDDVEAAFVRLLLEATRQTELPIYVVITMRSDFIGDCSEFRDLPELLNQAQFLIPRMTRDQRREAVEGPIAVSGATITPRLVQRMLNDVGDNPDQLPILQHALMRTWEAWYQAGKLDQPVDLDHYRSIGGWENALSLHADEAFNELDAAGKEIAQKVFKALVERGSDNRETRRPVQVGALSATAGASENLVTNVIDRFRLPGRTFLMPPAAVRLNTESVVDVSHESLIRLWKRLKDWVAEEVDSAIIYKRLADAAQRHKHGRGGLWRDPDLRIALEWKEKTHPNGPWAERYAPGFDDALEFLEQSHRDQERDRAERRAAQRLLRLRLKLLRGVAAVLVVVSLYASHLAYQRGQERQAAETARQSAEGRELTTRAYQTRDEHPEQSALLAIEAARKVIALNKYTVATDSVLREALRMVKPAASYPVAAGGGDQGCHGQRIATRSNRGKMRRDLFTPGGDKMDFSPVDNRFVAICQADKDSHDKEGPTSGLYNWNSTGRPVPLEGGSRDAAVAFTPDGSQIVAGGDDNGVRLVDIETERTIWRTDVEGPVAALSVGKRRDYVVAGFGEITNRDASEAESGPPSSTGGLALLNLKDGTTRLAPKLRGWVVDADFSPDGGMVAAADWNGEAILFSPDTGQELIPRVRRTFAVQQHDTEQHETPYNATSVAFSDDGRYVAFGFAASDLRSGAGKAVVYDTAMGKQMGRDITVSGEVATLRFSPTTQASKAGKIPALAVISRQDVWVEEWDPDAEVWQPRGDTHNSSATTIYSDAVFTPDGEYLVVADTGAYLYFYDPLWLEEVTRRRLVNLGELTGLKFDRSGEYLAAVGTRRTEVFDVQEKLLASRALKLRGTSPGKKGLARFSPNFATAVAPAGDDDSETVFILGRKGQFDSHRLVLETADSASDLQAVAAREDEGNLSSSSRPAAERQASNPVSSLAISADGKLIAVGDGAEIEVQNAASGKSLWSAHGDYESLAFSEDKHWLAAAGTEGIQLFKASNGSPLGAPRSIGRQQPRALVFSPHGRLIAVGTDSGVFMGRVTDGNFSRVDVRGVSRASALAFAPDEKQFAVGADDGTIVLVDFGSEPKGFSVLTIGSGARAESLEFSPDGRYLMALDSSNMVHLFDVALRAETSNLASFNSVFTASFDPDSPKSPRLLLAISNPDSISVLRTNSRVYADPNMVIAEVCGSLTRNFSCSEWREYFPNTQYRKTCPNLPPECE